MNTDTVVLILTTCETLEDARKISCALVSQHLAACVNISSPMESVFQWQGKLEMSSEHQLVIKTRSSLTEEVKALLEELHPYELPELLVITASDGSDNYLNWVKQSTHVN